VGAAPVGLVGLTAAAIQQQQCMYCCNGNTQTQKQCLHPRNEVKIAEI